MFDYLLGLLVGSLLVYWDRDYAFTCFGIVGAGAVYLLLQLFGILP